MVIRIIRAKNLLAKDTNGYSDPFVKVYLLPGREYVFKRSFRCSLFDTRTSFGSVISFSQENKRRTKHISKTLNPIWDYTVTYGNMHREELQYKMLEFTVWDYDRFKANDFLGQVTIDLKGKRVCSSSTIFVHLRGFTQMQMLSMIDHIGTDYKLCVHVMR